MLWEYVGDRELIRGLKENFPEEMILRAGSAGKKDDQSTRQEGQQREKENLH